MTDEFRLKFETTKKGEIMLFTKNKNEENGIISTQLSGSQTFITNVAFRLAINKMNAIKSKFLIIDEGFGTCDKEKLQNVDKLFILLKEEYDLCLIVSHIPIIQNYSDKRIEIVHDKNITKYSNINI